MKKILLIFVILFFIFSSQAEEKKNEKQVEGNKPAYELATFAGGCFWCLQPPFDKLLGKGVIDTHVGYSGGDKKDITYEQVSTGRTGHAESIQITYDPALITYEALLNIFWENIDPTDAHGQFVDRGSQYRPAIFYHNEEQKKIAVDSRKALDESKKYPKPIAVEITRYKFFVDAENYHQKYYKQNPLRYKFYKKGSGREAYIKKNQK